MLESPLDIEMDTSCILVFVKEHTRGFKETNVNVTKSIVELFLALCDYHEKAGQIFPKWAGEDGSIAATEKIADKKLSALSKNLLLSLCVVQSPHVIQTSAFAAVGKLKSPVAHEEFLKWFKSFCNEFGAASIGPGINSAVTFLEEVRGEAYSPFTRSMPFLTYFLLRTACQRNRGQNILRLKKQLSLHSVRCTLILGQPSKPLH
jgi:hypothetical protein